MWDSNSKHKAVLEMSVKHSLDLAACYAYGDTAGDFSMLKLVGYPYAVNPTRELITQILADEKLRREISVIVERKDVTYQLNVDCLELI
jgi:phosphoserine phosphatase